MPKDETVTEADECLDCGCLVSGALLEACVVKLGIVGGNMEKGFKGISRPARIQMLSIFELLGLSPVDALLDVIPRSNF
jgi:hypothetical protein